MAGTKRPVREFGPGANDPDRIAAFGREADLAARLATAVFHAGAEIVGYRAVHLVRYLVAVRSVVVAARQLTQCQRPKHDRLLPNAPAYRCLACAGCRLDTVLRILDESETHRLEFDAAVAREP